MSTLVGWHRLAAATVLIGGLGWMGCGEGPVTDAPPMAADDVAAEVEVVDVEVEIKGAEHEYAAAIADLESIAEAGTDILDPETSVVLEANLTVIDRAIDESRAALATAPASDVAQDSLFAALRSKVVLLQETVALINEMRKGNQEGAARIASELSQ